LVLTRGEPGWVVVLVVDDVELEVLVLAVVELVVGLAAFVEPSAVPPTRKNNTPPTIAAASTARGPATRSRERVRERAIT
jgi:hypothetical protein